MATAKINKQTQKKTITQLIIQILGSNLVLLDESRTQRIPHCPVERLLNSLAFLPPPRSQNPPSLLKLHLSISLLFLHKNQHRFFKHVINLKDLHRTQVQNADKLGKMHYIKKTFGNQLKSIQVLYEWLIWLIWNV